MLEETAGLAAAAEQALRRLTLSGAWQVFQVGAGKIAPPPRRLDTGRGAGRGGRIAAGLAVDAGGMARPGARLDFACDRAGCRSLAQGGRRGL